MDSPPRMHGEWAVRSDVGWREGLFLSGGRLLFATMAAIGPIDETRYHLYPVDKCQADCIACEALGRPGRRLSDYCSWMNGPVGYCLGEE